MLAQSGSESLLPSASTTAGTKLRLNEVVNASDPCFESQISPKLGWFCPAAVPLPLVAPVGAAYDLVVEIPGNVSGRV